MIARRLLRALVARREAADRLALKAEELRQLAHRLDVAQRKHAALELRHEAEDIAREIGLIAHELEHGP